MHQIHWNIPAVAVAGQGGAARATPRFDGARQAARELLCRPVAMTALSVALESAVADRRFRIAGALLAGLMLVVSAGFLAASKSTTELPAAATRVLPDVAYKIPIVRSLPEPQPRLSRAASSVSASLRGPRDRAARPLLAYTRASRRR